MFTRYPDRYILYLKQPEDTSSILRPLNTQDRTKRICGELFGTAIGDVDQPSRYFLVRTPNFGDRDMA
jgi:hypothetical protein